MTSNKHLESLIVYEQVPMNAETRPEALCENFITPIEQFFVRSHAPVPQIDPAAFRLTVGGMVGQALSLSLEDLKTRYEKCTIVAALQCAGNRRVEMSAHGEIPDEILWDLGAVGNAEWAGVSLRDVLLEAKLLDGVKHIDFVGLDQVEKEKSDPFPFGGSIPAARALEADVLLAYEMNGTTLPPHHGYPLRVIVPGFIGARSVKWLGHIHAQEGPSENYYQVYAYRMFPREVTAETVDWHSGKMIDWLLPNAVICTPEEGAALNPGDYRVRGFAIGGAETILAVELSIDGGKSWQGTQLETRGKGAWGLWEAKISFSSGTHELAARVKTEKGYPQPDQVADVWNFKGYLNDAYHRVRVTVG